MLAPQVGFQRREVKRAFPDCVVFEIPAKVFGAYDAAGALRMLLGLLGDDTLATPDPTDLRLAREVKNDQVLLLVSVIRKPKFTLISWRVYDRFTLVASGKVHKCHVNVNDLVDVLATLPYKNIEISDIDAVGIALPGAVDYGNVRFVTNVDEVVNVEKVLGERFGVRVFVDNNANAAAVGCYMTTDKYDSVVLHTQQTGYLVGGEGTVANGHLLRGRRGMAGELGSLDRRLFLQGGLHLPELGDNADPTFEDAEIRSEIVWEASRMLPILATTLIANICVTAPDAIYVAYDLIDDMDALREELAKTLDMDPAYLDRELGVGFSGGEKKKVEMLQLLLLEPKLAILDETDSGLDVDALSVVSRGMELYQKSCDGTLLVITHNTRILERLDVDRVHIMVKGRIVAQGPANLIAEIDADGFERYESDLESDLENVAENVSEKRSPAR
jgi:ABC-type arginine transport system ATPase subunit